MLIKNEKVNKPNFFILGAGKCGTSSLYQYLKQHPEIFMSPVKEPSFFCEHFQVVTDPIRYFNLFNGVKKEKIIGEASHVYLTNPSSAKILKCLFPDAKFLLIFRNPADRAYSLYHQQRRHGFEYINSFEKALEAEKWRNNSKEFKASCPHYFYNYLYFHSGLFGEQLDRYYSYFDKKQFHFLTLSQLKSNPLKELKKIYAFLEIDLDFIPEINLYNSGHLTTRFPFAQYHWTNTIKTRLKWNSLLDKMFQRYNFKEKKPINIETREHLLIDYRKDIEKLESLTGIKI